MDWDEAKQKPKTEIGEPLSNFGIAELETRITALQVEIERVKAELAKKRAHEAAASALFKS